MDKKSLITNFSVAVVAQGVTMVSNVVTALLLPKVLGVDAYGFWQLFVFYATYVGLFHFGLCDGVYLIEGGHVRSVIDKRQINSQFWCGLAYQFLIAAAIFVVAVIQNLADPRAYVLGMAAVLLLLANAFSYLVFVLQAMNETKKYSAASIINTLVFLLPTLALLLSGVSDFRLYIGFYMLGRIVSLAYSIWVTRDILGAGFCPLGETLRLTLHSIRVGVKLMLANITGMLILGVIQFFVNLNWDIATFSIVSFAIAMGNFFLTFVSQASMVLFPALRLADRTEAASFFYAAKDALNLFLPCVFVLYIPAKLILDLWLPSYHESLELFSLLIPLCIFNGKMDILGTTYLKVERKETSLLVINALAFGVSALGVAVATYGFHSLYGAIIAAMVVVIIRSYAAELYVGRLLSDSVHPEQSRGLSWIVVGITVVFVLTANLLSDWLSWIIIAAVYCVYLFAYRRRLKALVASLRHLNG